MALFIFSSLNSYKYSSNYPEHRFLYHFLLVLSAELKSPSEGEEIHELSDAEEAEAGAETSQASEGGDEVLDGVDHVLVVLDDGLVLEVHVEQGQVLLVDKLVLLVGPELLHDPAGLAGEARHAMSGNVLRVGAGGRTEASRVQG